MYRSCFFLAFLVILSVFSVRASEQYSYRDVFDEALNNADHTEEDEKLWMHYLEKAADVDFDQISVYFEKAALEFSVPVQLLQVIGYLENNWIQIGPSIDRGWGIMHLVENDYCDTLGQAAKLLNVDRQTLKDDPETNIRGAAALIAQHVRTRKVKIEKIEDWFSALAEVSGLAGDGLKNSQAYRYFEFLAQGVNEVNVFNQTVSIPAMPEINLARLKNFVPQRSETEAAAEYPGALAQYTPCNYTKGRSHDIDTWVVHYIAVGTYAGAISWFNNSSAKASAHFCIRQSDGEITQVIKTTDTAWHCGAKLGPGASNNQRSIGIEHEVTITHPEWWHSEPMLKESAKLTRFFCDKYDIPKAHKFPGILGHNEMPDTSTSCPGDCPWDKLMGLINEGSTNPGGYAEGVVNTDGTNVRKGPDATYSVLTTLNKGAVVKIAGSEGSWLKVILADERTGYIHKTLVTLK